MWNQSVIAYISQCSWPICIVLTFGNTPLVQKFLVTRPVFLRQLAGSPVEIYGNENRRLCSLVNLNLFPHIVSVCGVFLLLLFFIAVVVFLQDFHPLPGVQMIYMWRVPCYFSTAKYQRGCLNKNNHCVQLLKGPVYSTAQYWSVLFISTSFVSHTFCYCA